MFPAIVSHIHAASIIPHKTPPWQPRSNSEKERQIKQLHSNTEGPLKSKRLISLAGFSSPSSPSFLSRFLTLQLERLTVRGSQRHSSRHTSDLPLIGFSTPLLLFCSSSQVSAVHCRARQGKHTHSYTEVHQGSQAELRSWCAEKGICVLFKISPFSQSICR